MTNPHIQWLGQYSWQGAPDQQVLALQTAVYMILDKAGYVMPTVDGVISPVFCGALSMVTAEKMKGNVSDADWNTLISLPGWGEVGLPCQGTGKTMIAPTKKDGTGGGEFYTDTGEPVGGKPKDTTKKRTSYTALLAGLAITFIAVGAVFARKEKRG